MPKILFGSFKKVSSSSFESEEALKGYAVHEAHVKVADTKVRPHTKSRVCIDYEV